MVLPNLGLPICCDAAYMFCTREQWIYNTKYAWQSQILEKRNCTTEVFLFEIEWKETKTSWEHFEVDAYHLFGAIASVKRKRASPKMSNFLSHSASVLKITKDALLVLLEASVVFGSFGAV